MEKTHARYMTALDSLRSEHESLHREAITGHTNHLNSLKTKHKRTRAESSERHGASVTALQSSLELQQAKHDETGERREEKRHSHDVRSCVLRAAACAVYLLNTTVASFSSLALLILSISSSPSSPSSSPFLSLFSSPLLHSECSERPTRGFNERCVILLPYPYIHLCTPVIHVFTIYTPHMYVPNTPQNTL